MDKSFGCGIQDGHTNHQARYAWSFVEYKPINRLPPNNIQINCVIFYINIDGNVDGTPKVG
jgi:hypothetical protein